MKFLLLIVEKIAGLLVMWGLLSLAVAPIHEWCHVGMIRFMGGEAYVSYTPGYIATGGFTHFITVPDHGLWWVYFAGGLGVFLGCMIIWGWARKTKTLWDMAFELPAISIALWQISYAFVEACIYPNNQELFYRIVVYPPLFGLVAGLAIEAKKLWRWLTTKETIIRKELYW